MRHEPCAGCSTMLGDWRAWVGPVGQELIVCRDSRVTRTRLAKKSCVLKAVRKSQGRLKYDEKIWRGIPAPGVEVVAVQSPLLPELVEQQVHPHNCHAIGCKVEVEPRFLMCPKHWWMVPEDIRNEVWKQFNPRQCQDVEDRPRPSGKWMVAAEMAICEVALKEGKITEAQAARLLEQAREYQRREEDTTPVELRGAKWKEAQAALESEPERVRQALDARCAEEAARYEEEEEPVRIRKKRPQQPPVSKRVESPSGSPSSKKLKEGQVWRDKYDYGSAAQQEGFTQPTITILRWDATHVWGTRSWTGRTTRIKRVLPDGGPSGYELVG